MSTKQSLARSRVNLTAKSNNHSLSQWMPAPSPHSGGQIAYCENKHCQAHAVVCKDGKIAGNDRLKYSCPS